MDFQVSGMPAGVDVADVAAGGKSLKAVLDAGGESRILKC
jgi:hypothetical protein